MLLQANRGVFGHQCNLGPILPHLYATNIVPAQKLPKLQYLKENSSQPCKESFQNFTFNMKEHFFNLSVVELCILQYNGPVSVQNRIYIICKRMHRRKSITVQYSASSMLKANLFWDQFGLYIGLEIIFYERLCEMSTFRNPENDHISAQWPTNLRALYFLELQKNKAISLNYDIILVSKP